MNGTTAVKKIGIWGHYGNGNLGDEAAIAAVIQNIKQRYPDTKLYGFSGNPDDTQKRHQITTFPIRRVKKKSPSGQPHRENQSRNLIEKQPQTAVARMKIVLKKISALYAFLKGCQKILLLFLNTFAEVRFAMSSCANLRRLDLLIIAGSGPLFDYFGGPWNFPYNLFKWSMLAKAAKTELAFMSVGAGPIDSSFSRFLIKHALACASYHSYRDESSKQLIETMGVAGENLVCPDLAYSLQIPTVHSLPAAPASLSIVGINPMPFFDQRYWPENSRDMYEGYIRKLAAFASWLIQKDYVVLFFPTQLRADPPVIQDIKAILTKNGALNCKQQIIDQPICTFNELLARISMADIVIATRFHGIIFSYLLNKPVLGISYFKKTDDLMAAMGQADYVLDINHFDLPSLIDRFSRLEANSERIKAQIRQKIAEHRCALAKQYERVLNYA